MTPLKKEKKKLFNELVSVKGDYADYCFYQLSKRCLYIHESDVPLTFPRS